MASSSAPRDSEPRAASCRIASEAAATRRCSDSSHDSNAAAPSHRSGLRAAPSPAPAARRRPSTSPRATTSTSTTDVRGQPQHDRVTLDRRCSPPSARRISDRPQRSAPQRVVGLGEQQRGQLAAGRRPLAEQQIGQQRPALAATDLVPTGTAPRSTDGRAGGRFVSLRQDVISGSLTTPPTQSRRGRQDVRFGKVLAVLVEIRQPHPPVGSDDELPDRAPGVVHRRPAPSFPIGLELRSEVVIMWRNASGAS